MTAQRTHKRLGKQAFQFGSIQSTRVFSRLFVWVDGRRWIVKQWVEVLGRGTRVIVLAP
jgi:hypothetical protein